MSEKSPKRGQIETFAENLPGFVDNIRRNPRGNYWVGLSRVRHAGMPSVLDTYGDRPNMRGAIMGVGIGHGRDRRERQTDRQTDRRTDRKSETGRRRGRKEQRQTVRVKDR